MSDFFTENYNTTNEISNDNFFDNEMFNNDSLYELLNSYNAIDDMIENDIIDDDIIIGHAIGYDSRSINFVEHLINIEHNIFDNYVDISHNQMHQLTMCYTPSTPKKSFTKNVMKNKKSKKYKTCMSKLQKLSIKANNDILSE